MHNIKDINIQNKRIIIRVDYNVPINNANITDDYRIVSSIETINYCLNNNASIVLMSHLGRPNGTYNKRYSLKPIYNYINKKINTNVFYSDDCISDDSIIKSKKLKSKEIHLLENLRFYNEEVENDDVFSKRLSMHADIYINDAFGTVHRSHASNVGILKYFDTIAYGFLISKELKFLLKIVHTPPSPCIVLLGGAKVNDKIPLINNMLGKVKKILIGGAMSFTFLCALGKNVGSSIVDKESIKIAKNILFEAEKYDTKIILPIDVACSTDMNNLEYQVKSIDNLYSNETGYDIGPDTILLFKSHIKDAKTIIWNGPMGVYEISQYSKGTKEIAKYIANCTINGSTSIIGGGDISSALKNINMNNLFTHISTGGGASLKLMSGEVLPALKGIYEK